MADTDPPTLGEIMRIVVKIEAQQVEILREIKADRVEAAKTYMRQDVWISERNLINATIADTRTDLTQVDAKTDRAHGRVDDEHKARLAQRDADATGRRQTWVAIGTTALMALIAIAGMVLSAMRT